MGLVFIVSLLNWPIFDDYNPVNYAVKADMQMVAEAVAWRDRGGRLRGRARRARGRQVRGLGWGQAVPGARDSKFCCSYME